MPLRQNGLIVNTIPGADAAWTGGAAASELGSNPTTTTNLTIVSNKLKASGGTGLAVYTAPGPDMEMQVTIGGIGATNLYNVFARQNADGAWYAEYVHGTGVKLYRKYSGATLTELFATIAGALANGDILQISAIGTTIRALVNGQVKAAVNHEFNYLATGAGFGVTLGDGNGTIDNVVLGAAVAGMPRPNGRIVAATISK